MASRRGFSKRDAERVGALLKALEGGKHFLILLQNSPDPDAIASAAALRHLVREKAGLDAHLAYAGIVGRAENRALVKTLGIELEHVRNVAFADYDRIALVDTQPGVGNNALPPGTPVHVVIDHHPRAKATRDATFADIRPKYGSTATILYGYLEAAGLSIPPDLVVAMTYGIRSDTLELGRQATPSDTAAYLDLYPQADKRVLAGIAHANLPPAYFRLLATALERTLVTGAVVTSSLGDMNNPDMIAEVADLMLRLETSEWVLCYGFFERRLIASVRTSDADGDAHTVIRTVVEGLGTGGGHRVMAGAQIPVEEDTVAERERLSNEVETRFRKALGVGDRTPRPLLELASTTSVATTSDDQ